MRYAQFGVEVGLTWFLYGVVAPPRPIRNVYARNSKTRALKNMNVVVPAGAFSVEDGVLTALIFFEKLVTLPHFSFSDERHTQAVCFPTKNALSSAAREKFTKMS